MNHHFNEARVELPHDTIPSSITRFYLSKAIRGIVGPQSNQQIFYLYEPFLKAESEYFKQVLNGSFLEIQSMLIDLEEEDSLAFDLFAQHLYNTPSWAYSRNNLSVVFGVFVSNALSVG